MCYPVQYPIFFKMSLYQDLVVTLIYTTQWYHSCTKMAWIYFTIMPTHWLFLHTTSKILCMNWIGYTIYMRTLEKETFSKSWVGTWYKERVKFHPCVDILQKIICFKLLFHTQCKLIDQLLLVHGKYTNDYLSLSLMTTSFYEKHLHQTAKYFFRVATCQINVVKYSIVSVVFWLVFHHHQNHFWSGRHHYLSTLNP